MNFNLIGNVASGKSTLINIYNEIDLSDKIPTVIEPLIDDSLDQFYRDLKNNFFIFQFHVIGEILKIEKQSI
jgi:hypothetical protein